MKKTNRYTCTAILGVKQTYLFINLFLEKIDYVNYCKKKKKIYIYIYPRLAQFNLWLKVVILNRSILYIDIT